MTELLYLKNHYLKEFKAIVTEVLEENEIILDQTNFYYTSGGQPSDLGKIIKDNKEFQVLNVRKEQGKIIHEVNLNGLQRGDKIRGIIDWKRRYQLMKSHTAAHIISEVIHKETGALITGNQIDIGKTRIDFALDEFSKEKMQKYIDQANEIINKDLPISIEFITKGQAEKMPQISKLAMGLPSFINEIRIVRIGGFDMQADGGTHVHSTKEIGKIELVKTENKGKNNRRMYFKVV